MIVDLIRLETDFDCGTFGALLINKEFFCVTLEPYSFDNIPSESCIPEGQYDCRRVISPKHGETFEICHVPKRSLVRFHPGNTKHDTEGCPILGQYPDKLRFQRAIHNSGKTFQAFMDRMQGVKEFKLCVKAVW